MLLALYHGWVCYFFPVLGFKVVQNEEGYSSEHWLVSSISFTLCLHVVTYKLFLESYFWTNIQMYCCSHDHSLIVPWVVCP